MMNQKDWQKSWEKHLEQYLQGPARNAFFILKLVPEISSSLEIGCGSSRDSIFLSRKGINATATDFEPNLIENLKARFKLPNLNYQQADAFRLPFAAKSFDLVFHNGLFVLFNNNADIIVMLKEQERVAKHYILFFVHNRLNFPLLEKFKKLAADDPIYNIRFFSPEEVRQIVRSAGLDSDVIEIYKFGGLSDIFLMKRIKKIIPNLLYPFRQKIVPELYRYQKWEQTERIACLIKLKK